MLPLVKKSRADRSTEGSWTATRSNKEAHTSPVPLGQQTLSTTIPSFSKKPSSTARCSGDEKCSGTRGGREAVSTIGQGMGQTCLCYSNSTSCVPKPTRRTVCVEATMLRMGVWVLWVCKCVCAVACCTKRRQW